MSNNSLKLCLLYNQFIFIQNKNKSLGLLLAMLHKNHRKISIPRTAQELRILAIKKQWILLITKYIIAALGNSLSFFPNGYVFQQIFDRLISHMRGLPLGEGLTAFRQLSESQT